MGTVELTPEECRALRKRIMRLSDKLALYDGLINTKNWHPPVENKLLKQWRQECRKVEYEMCRC